MEEGKGKRHGDGEGMSHLSEFTSVMFTSVISQVCSHTEGAKQEERCLNRAAKCV